MTLSFLPANAFPLPSSLAPTLVTLGLDDKAARTVSKVYLSAALALKERCETEYVNACHALVAAGDDRGYSSKELRAKLLTASITRYSKALSTWVEEVIQKAKKSVLKKGGKHINQYEVSSCYPPHEHLSKFPRRRKASFLSHLDPATLAATLSLSPEK